MSEQKPDGIELSIRLDLPDGSRFGPGKAALLAALSKSGSISAAARSLGMSYPKALRLIGEMNKQFSAPLITTYQGGAKRGGADLTELGTRIYELYADLIQQSNCANQTTLNTIKDLT